MADKYVRDEYLTRVSFTAYMSIIKEYEQRLGAYLAVDGTTKEDPYAKLQLKCIAQYRQELDNKLHNLKFSKEEN